MFIQQLGYHRFSFPYIVYGLIAANIGVFLGTFANMEAVSKTWGLVPQSFSIVNSFASTFLHAGVLHILGNALFLYAFGPKIEDVLGHWLFLPVYLGLGLGADLGYTLFYPASTIPSIGASGAISGLMGLYVVFFPNAKVQVFFSSDDSSTPAEPITMSAYFAIGLWFLGQLFLSFLSLAYHGTSVAYAAHAGGLVTGIVFGMAFRLIGVYDSFESRIRASRTSAKTIYCPACKCPIIAQSYGRYRCPDCQSEFLFERTGYRLLN